MPLTRHLYINAFLRNDVRSISKFWAVNTGCVRTNARVPGYSHAEGAAKGLIAFVIFYFLIVLLLLYNFIIIIHATYFHGS